ncbi:MAG: M28 family peptidase, partial [Gemmatimonadota bacterium]|nr:M28 family peptidase [Gemmatimonadota bacterium]
MRRAIAGTLAVLALLALASGSARTGIEQIRAGDLERHVRYLSADSLAGRDTGQPGIRKAEKYIAKEFKKAGLTPLPGNSDYWVDFDLYRQGYDAESTALSVDVDGRTESGSIGESFRPFPFSDEGVVEAPVVFVGYGITAPEHDYDDYDGVDVEGKIVIMLRHEPAEKDPNSSFDGEAHSRHAQFNVKGQNAQDHGAAGMLLVTDPLHHGPDDDLRVGGQLRLRRPERQDADEDGSSPFVAAHISQELAAAIVSPSGYSLEELQRAVDEGTAPSELSLDGVHARLDVARPEHAEVVPARNVAGFLEGGDPRLKDEWIVIGGHHDHVGGYHGQGDTVYNGADDNASGTSGVIALARAFAARERRPRRSIAFMTFSAEEKGLLGSRALVRQRLIPVEKVAFMLNLDMIGRNPDQELQLFGDGYVRGLREITEAANRDIDLPIRFAGAGYTGNSDHDPFYDESIPFLFFFTGVHDDYHQLGDHADKLDYGRMESILQVAYGIVDRLAEADDAPGFIHHITWLGLQVELLDEGAGPLAVLTGVDEESRAQQAGLRAGDVLTAFDSEPLEDPQEVGRVFSDIDPGTSVALSVLRK